MASWLQGSFIYGVICTAGVPLLTRDSSTLPTAVEPPMCVQCVTRVSHEAASKTRVHSAFFWVCVFENHLNIASFVSAKISCFAHATFKTSESGLASATRESWRR
eukprot:m.433633 g.433633  ORF g.433633 m.433633 type:complete len:105 (-) comp17598_c0_seq1:1038-1352(-)